MSVFKAFLYSISLIVFLASCSNHTYEPISSDISLAATVNMKSMSVTFIDVEKREIAAEWQLEKPYTGGIVFPDGDTFLLYGKEMETADLFSLQTGEKKASWDTGKGIVNAKVINDQKEIALVNQNNSSVIFYDLDGEKLAEAQTESSPLSIVESEEEGVLFVLSFKNQTLSKVNLKTKKTIGDYPIHGAASGALLLEDGTQLWLGGHGEGATIEKDIHVYNASDGEFIKKIPAPVMPINFLQYQQSIFVLSHGSNQLYKMDLDGNIMGTVKVGANPFELALTSDHTLLVAGYDSNDLSFINPENLEEEDKIEVGNGPFKIVLREKTE
ncbi:MAG: WD40 repeat domain-containing protein [Cytobacillus gottheilii]|uniref:YncE family protein n=1 Tax=Cytobacillus gottheilii TaxID=859144 RepID=UPI00083033D3|nr:hypothetical protein [Cytobacillus gottheilii]